MILEWRLYSCVVLDPRSTLLINHCKVFIGGFGGEGAENDQIKDEKSWIHHAFYSIDTSQSIVMIIRVIVIRVLNLCN